MKLSTKASWLFTAMDGENGNRKWEMGRRDAYPGAHFPFSISDFRRSFLARFIRILASYFRHLFLRLSTVVHTAFQRVSQITSRCRQTHLAHSPHSSTCAINMNDNNLREGSLLRPETLAPTLRTPRPNRSAAELQRDHRRSCFSTCISSPVIARLDLWNPRRARRCAKIPRTSSGKASGQSRTRATTRAAFVPTAVNNGTASSMRHRASLNRG